MSINMLSGDELPHTTPPLNIFTVCWSNFLNLMKKNDSWLVFNLHFSDYEYLWAYFHVCELSAFLLLITDHLTQIINDDVITNLEPDILEGKVKWALESIITKKASGGGGIPAELFQILKYDAIKVFHSICQQMWTLSSGHRTGKGQFSFQSLRKAMPNNV